MDKTVIAVAPVGEASRGAIEAILPGIRETFGAETILAPRVAMPVSAYDPKRRQTLSTAILDALAAAKRPEWERLIGVADVDLYVPDLNFVFGEGDSRRGVAVFSLARLHTRNESLFRKRAATEAIHELGHTYGLAHCSDPGCVMWFSNTLSESDRKGTRFCSRHAAEQARARARSGPA
jgi:archaemetzincin